MQQDASLRITILGALINLALGVAKIVVGSLASSISLVADGIHSFSDLVTDAAVIVGSKAAQKPPDASHPYGHGKIETLAAAFVSLVLVLVGIGIMYQSIRQLYEPKAVTLAWWVLLAAGLSIVSKEWLFHATRQAARKTGNAAAMANAWHHRSDALSSVAVLAGFAAMQMGFDLGDQIAGIIVGFMVLIAGGNIFAETLMQLTDSAVDDVFYRTLTDILRREPEVRNWHACKGRRVGREIYLECHVLVQPETSVEQSHALTVRIEKELNTHLEHPANLLIHIEPYYPDARQVSETTKAT